MRIQPFLFAPLLLLAAPAPAQNVDWAHARRIDVAMSNFSFEPAAIKLEAGRPYLLHLHTSGGHSFAARAFFAAAQVLPADKAKIAGGKIDLADGESADIRFVAPAAGTYEIHCTHFLHSGFGMTGSFVVG